jgi:prevent-host-death family protein
MYILCMSAVEVSVTDARAGLADIVNRAAYAHESAYLTKQGKRVAAVVPADALELLDRVEDLVLSLEAHARLDDAGLLGAGDADLVAASRPLADVLAELSAD